MSESRSCEPDWRGRLISGLVVVALDAFADLAEGCLPFDGTAIDGAMLALVLVPQFLYPAVGDGDRCPAFQGPPWIEIGHAADNNRQSVTMHAVTYRAVAASECLPGCGTRWSNAALTFSEASAQVE
jgi:hypothetical protein